MRLRAFSVLVVAAGMVCLTCAPPSDSTPLAAELSLSVSADTYQTFPFNGRSVEVSSITVHAEPSGGVEPYSYRWSVTNPRGQSDDGRLSAIDVRAPVFTSGDLVGPYTLTCVVTDAAGRTVSDSIVITVGQQLVLDLRLGRQWVASGGGLNGQSTITAKPIGGTAPYTYEWSAIGPDGERDNDRLADATSATQVFTSGDAVGTYIVSCSATDAEGLLFADSVTIVVSNLLSVDVGVDRQQLVPGGAANGAAFLTSYVEGGAPPYTYAWTVTGPDGLTDNERLDDATVAQPCFTSADINGTYRAACTVTDSSGQQLSDSVLILVGPGVVLTVTATRKEVAAAGGGTGQAGLTATALGGTGPLTYQWSVTNPDGQPENDRLDSLTIQSPTFTSSTTLGTYRIFCTVIDADGRMGFDSVEVFVGQPISVDVVTNRQDVPADGGEATLTANALGGLPPYQYSWRVYNPSGAMENARLNSATVSSPVFTSVLTTGTYTVTCTVLDSGGFAAVDSVGLVVGGGLDQGLALDVATNRLNVPATGGAATLAAVVSGGVAPHTY
ncbi:MAG: hypothetical protein JXA69_09040, partial [Phycisphaerae bacterium]|nr:hypothetical protein [Phycisphaerae bacterium]